MLAVNRLLPGFKNMTPQAPVVPVIDLFAGPGGLGEGFSAAEVPGVLARFEVRLSIEKDPIAHETLFLRSFFRRFPHGQAPSEYYDFLMGRLRLEDLLSRYPEQARAAEEAAWLAELGPTPHSEIDTRVRKATADASAWVLVGGPPCQAYSIIGRSRVGGIKDSDSRVYLYQEYLRILATHRPPVFVMENVKGLLSARIQDKLLFSQILHDLQDPASASSTDKATNDNPGVPSQYTIFSLVNEQKAPWHADLDAVNPLEFVIRSEDYGIPQRRHRVILLGVRADLEPVAPKVLGRSRRVSALRVLEGLPRLRSGLSKEADSAGSWKKAVCQVLNSGWLTEMRDIPEKDVADRIRTAVEGLGVPWAGRGGEFIGRVPSVAYRRDWFLDPHLPGVCNHATRGHIIGDLHRYLFVACFGKALKRSPDLADLPKPLLPAHKNAAQPTGETCFADRFRVQLSGRPATTVTSHISKDGHYYIHYDPRQCRSLTVREAARLQTFPDNYFFAGPRTAQYVQVGNAVPPLSTARCFGRAALAA